ncbi:hypothetical protein PVK06_034370 [Gossypium arboreum]|uniref:Uncharacterized protein n=1 Tax=Gossypium arboreum TaxID=29729 RepID=A0ABR0NE12_GOSAR|nr:hypothetical protein PVK06_034370 [Gossypium arboreum]
MDDFYYIWSDEDFDYDGDIYEDKVYDDWKIQENQRLLMLKLSQLQGEIPDHPQDDNNRNDMPSKRYQEVPSLKLHRKNKVIIGKAEVPTSTSPSSNDEGFNIKMIDHLTPSIESHNRVITKIKAKLFTFPEEDIADIEYASELVVFISFSFELI